MRVRNMHAGKRRREGSALLISLILVTAAAGISYGMLRFNTAIAKRQRQATDDRRALYVAEAGLSEAYFALSKGYTGTIGSPAAPTRVGEGFVWVRSALNQRGEILLESTGLCGRGRATMAVTVAPQDVPVGVFSDAPIELNGTFLMDGYDSTKGTYESQIVSTGLQAMGYAAPASGGEVDDDEDDNLVTALPSCGYEWCTVHLPGTTYEPAIFMPGKPSSGSSDVLSPTISDPYTTNVLLLDESTSTSFEDSALTASGSLDGTTPTATESGFEGWTWSASDADSALTETSTSSGLGSEALAGPTTSGGGVLGSNNDILLNADSTTPGVLFGDAVPGVGGSLQIGPGVQLQGNSSPRSNPVILSPVEVPDTSSSGSLLVDSTLPVVLPPMTNGYDSIVVQSGGVLLVQGPAVLVAGSLQLEAGAQLVLDDSTGSIDLIVEGEVDLAVGSKVSVTKESPGALSLQAAGGTGLVTLAAESNFYGVVYAPERTVQVQKDFEIYGTIIAGALQLGADVRLHFDEGLYAGKSRIALPRLLLWELLTPPIPLALDRRDAGSLLRASLAETPQPNQLLESTSWTFETTYVAVDGTTKTFEGPYEAWDPEDASTYLSGSLRPPTIDLGEEWSVSIEYDDASGTRSFYEGPLANLPIFEVQEVFTQVVTPPSVLGELERIDAGGILDTTSGGDAAADEMWFTWDAYSGMFEWADWSDFSNYWNDSSWSKEDDQGEGDDSYGKSGWDYDGSDWTKNGADWDSSGSDWSGDQGSYTGGK